MTPLHWAAVKGSRACIRHLIQAGADLDVKEDQGKTARDMAEELKGLVPFVKGLEEAGYSSLGVPQLGRFSEVSLITCGGKEGREDANKTQRNTRIILFLLPAVALWTIFQLFALLPIYTSLPLSLALFFLTQMVSNSYERRAYTYLISLSSNISSSIDQKRIV